MRVFDMFEVTDINEMDKITETGEHETFFS